MITINTEFEEIVKEVIIEYKNKQIKGIEIGS